MISSQLKVFLAVVAMVLMVPAFAAGEPLIFTDPEQEARYQQLTIELRCLVCQNQNLADSDAPLAQDLRQEIYDMMQAGRTTDDEIKQFLIDRYGDFVLYMPPVKSNTLVLWLMPAVLLFGGALVVIIVVRKRGLNPGGQEEENS
jgi:cytochrome c-type biogenesis protein CcmH